MPLMEVAGAGQDGRDINLYSQIHGHNSERSSGAKTPKTPSVRESTPNYNEMYLSGRSSREKTPSVRNGSGEKTPTGYDHRLPPSGRSSGDKTPRENERRVSLHEHNRSVNRIDGERSPNKRERPSEAKRIYDAEEDDGHNQRSLGVAHPGSGSNTVAVSRRPGFQSSDRHHEYRRASSVPHGKNTRSKFTDVNSRGKICDEDSTEDDSAYSVFRGQWNSTPCSQVTVVQEYVQARAKALGKYDNLKEMSEDEWGTDFKKPKTKTLTKQKAVAAVLAFQRWRHTQLKKLFSMELKKVLEEAKEDEACLATLEKELATKDKQLAKLRSQLSHYEKSTQEQMNQRQMHELLGANVEELEKECHKALERASLAEEVLRKRDVEVLRLTERLRSLDEEGVRVESELHTNIKLLQKEKECALEEGRVLLAQLARRDEEVTQQCKEVEKLRSTVAQLADRQTSQQKVVDCMKVDHQGQLQNLQDKLQQSYAAKHAKEMELASYTERCNGLGQERQNLLIQLHRAVERADLASRRAEELQMKLHCTAEERAKASEDVAGEMVEHLKRLTGHMKELETSVDQNSLFLPNSDLQRKAGLAKISAKLAQAEVDTLNLITDTDVYEGEGSPGLPEGVEESRRQVCFSMGRKGRKRQDWSNSAITPFRNEGDSCTISSIDRDIAFTKFKNWTAWKWRWAASAAKADSLFRQLQNQDAAPKYNYVQEGKGSIFQRETARRERAISLVNKLGSAQFDDLRLPDEKKVGPFIMRHNLMPLIISAWRAFTRMSSLERKATSRNESLSKIISALPWWIRRVGERRLAERYFFHWQLLTLRAAREKSQENEKKKIVPFMNPISQSRVRGHDGDPRQVQAHARHQTSIAPTQVPAHSVRDAEVQTGGITSQEMDVEFKQRTPTPGTTLKAGTRFPHRAKSEPRTAIPCPTCDMRRRFSGSLQHQQQPTRKLDPQTAVVNNTTFTARALRAMQSSLQQELKELQYHLSQEMQDAHQVPVDAGNHGKVGGAELNRPALKSIFEVCNNLAHALVDVRSQLCNGGNEAKSRGESPLPTTPRTPHETAYLRTRHTEAKDTWENGSGSKEKSLMRCRPSTSSGLTAPRYASPIGRERGLRFSSPSCQLNENSVTTREAWNSPRSGPSAASTRQAAEREAKTHASNTSRESREVLARQEDRQYVHENYPRSRRQSLQQTDETEDMFSRGESAPLMSREAKARQRDDDDKEYKSSVSKLPPPPDYTTVVQILNQDNTKIGEVAIHTSAVTDRTSDRVGISEDLFGSPKKDPVLPEDKNHSTQKTETHQTQLRPPASEEFTESMYRSSQPAYRPKSALRSPARAQSTPHERAPSQSIVKRHVHLNPRMTDSRLVSSLSRKQCMGSEYAALLKSEILRLREGRLTIEDCNNFVPAWEGGVATTSRELTPRSSSFASRPIWRPHYTNAVSCSKK